MKFNPAHTSNLRFHPATSIAKRRTGKLWIPIFIFFGLTRGGVKPKSTQNELNYHLVVQYKLNLHLCRKLIEIFSVSSKIVNQNFQALQKILLFFAIEN